MQKIEHIGIAVKNLEEAEKNYTRIFGRPPYKRESVPSERVLTSFFRAGPNKIELLQGTDSESVIAKYVEKYGEGIHHVAYAVTDILEQMNRLSSDGYRLLNAEPKEGADNKWVCFLHPKDTSGTLIELCQERTSQPGEQEASAASKNLEKEP